MFDLFRQYRNRVLQHKSKIIGYFFYAIGEITLVAIGILIAVNVDNWNERRKKSEAMHEVVMAIAKDLKEDIDQYRELLLFLNRKDSLLRKIITGEMTEGDYRGNWKELRSLITTTTTFYMHKGGFAALQRSIEDVPKELKPVVDELTNYYLYNAEDANAVLLRQDRLVWKTIEDWEKYEWDGHVRKDNKVNEPMLRYLLTSQEYKNKSTTFLANTRNAISVCEGGRDFGLEILDKLAAFEPKVKE